MGQRINSEVLRGERAAYGKQVIPSLASELVVQYGKSFETRNLRRMMQFAELYSDFQILTPLASQLSWTHFTVLLMLPDDAARRFYARQAIDHVWGKRELIRQIERKAFERAHIADSKLALAAAADTTPDVTHALAGSFKDPYFFDFLGLPQGYLENDLEQALIRELEQFILELGKGFAFVERQKRMIIDGEDFYLDLLFYHRRLKRLVAVELKIDRFKAAHKGQMELYLNWLDKFERQPGEAAPIGLILCAQAGTEQVELMWSTVSVSLSDSARSSSSLKSSLLAKRTSLSERYL